MALFEEELRDIWERQIQAETRALYFADLTATYAKYKQALTFLTFFLSSGAAATLIGKLPSWVPLVLSLLGAVISAYSVAVGLDRRIATLSKLHGDWTILANGYAQLRARPEIEEAESVLSDLRRRDLEASALATTEAPNQPKRMDRWTDHVFRAHGIMNA